MNSSRELDGDWLRRSKDTSMEGGIHSNKTFWVVYCHPACIIVYIRWVKKHTTVVFLYIISKIHANYFTMICLACIQQHVSSVKYSVTGKAASNFDT